LNRKAVVDVGSNSVLLLVEEQSGDKWKPVIERTWVTSLGEGTKETMLLSEQGMERTLGALSEAFAVAREAKAGTVLAGATMAARIATNVEEFLGRAARQDTPVFVLSGEHEAQLGFEAVAYDPAFAGEHRLSIVDVGGQSTELATAERDRDWRMLFRRSFSIGTLALRGKTLRDECPGPQAILQAVVEVDDTIGLCYRRDECGHAVTLGATGTNLVTIREGMREWDPVKVHGAWLDYEEISRAVGNLMPMTEAERRSLVGIEPGREATLPAGALILERFLNAIGATGCSVSVRGWRHALLERGLPGEK
jgi:exopolyphosphatase / guanosine-5'-triphosphate,3'-diphosphate pyrophosphatase